MILELSSGGKTIAPQYIQQISGFEAGEYELILAEGANSDGGTVTGRRTLPRPLEIVFDVFTEAERREMIAFFNPKRTGRIYVSRDGVERRIDYEVETVEFEQATLFHPATITAGLLCPQPYFLSIDDFGQNVAAKRAQFAFPWRGVVGQGQIMGYNAFAREVNLQNGGDMETGLTAVFTAARGPVSNPSILYKSTGEFLKVMLEMEQGDVLEVSTNQRDKHVTLNGGNIFQKIDRQSSFFQLSPGDNVVEYDADANYLNLDVRIYYTQKYLGV